MKTSSFDEGIQLVIDTQDAPRTLRAVRAFGRGPLIVLTGAVIIGAVVAPLPARAQSAGGGTAAVTPPDKRSHAPRDTLRLTLADARTLALRSNPELRAARLGVDIARGELRQAGLLLNSNPSADVLGGGTGTEVGLTQEIEVAGQRGARRAAGRAGVERAQAGILDATRLTVADVDRGFYRLAANRQRELLSTEVLALNARLADAAARQLAAGSISQLDANLATVEYGRSRSRALAARRDRQQAENDLQRLLGAPPWTPISPVVEMRADLGADLRVTSDSVHTGARADSASRSARVLAQQTGAAAQPLVADTTSDAPSDSRSIEALILDTLSVDSLTALALARRPDLGERAAAARQALARASLARRETFPNLALRGSSERLEGSEGRVFRPGVGITLPAFNRKQGEVQARRAEARQAELEGAALAAAVRVEVARAIASYETAAAEVDVLERTVLTPARENRRLLEVAYRAGKVGLPVLLLIRNQVIDAELEYWDAWLATREAIADLSEATGENVMPPASGMPR